MSDVAAIALVLPLAGLVLWLAQRSFMAVARSQTLGMPTLRPLLLLLACSFMLGAVIRWVNL